MRRIILATLVFVCGSAQAAPPPSYELNLGLYRPSSNNAFAYSDLNTRAFTWNRRYGAPGDVPVVGDFDANGVWDLAVYRNGTWFVDTTHDSTPDSTLFFGGAQGDVPLTGDFNRDGRADLVIFRNGTWYVSAAQNGALSAVYSFGAAGDVPLLGDYNGDFLPDLTVYRNGIWFIDTDRNGTADRTIGYGGAVADRPIVFDWNHDNRSDLAIFRNGTWLISTQLDGTVQDSYSFGAAGDIPLAGGVFTLPGSIYVRAGAAGGNGTFAAPFGTIGAAFNVVTAGGVVRIAPGTYPETVEVFGPAVQYAPGLFGKNDVKFLGVHPHAVRITPASGDSFSLVGSTGTVLQRMHLNATNGRGVAMIGGAGSVNPELPGATATMRFNRFQEVLSYGVLITGTSNATLLFNEINRSRTKSGVGMQGGTPMATIFGNDISENGYTIGGSPFSNDGNGIEAQASSTLSASNNQIRLNNRFGVIAIVDTDIQLVSNTIEGNRGNGIIVCGSGAGDTSTATVTSNWIAGNGTAGVRFDGFNGLEIFTTCTLGQTVSGNAFIGNSLNGIYHGSATAVITNNTFSQNTIGITLNSVASSAAPVNATIRGNTFTSNELDGVYAARSGSTLTATIGGTSAGQSNSFSGHSLHAIGCETGQEALTCPSGGNTFATPSDNIEGTCPTTCRP